MKETFVETFDAENHEKTEFIIELYVLIEVQLIDGNYRTYHFAQ